jgi:hypothetical protein
VIAQADRAAIPPDATPVSAWNLARTIRWWARHVAARALSGRQRPPVMAAIATK